MNTTDPNAPDVVQEAGESPEDDARARSLSLGGTGGGLPTGKLFKVFEFLGAVREEMRKVTWPTRRMVITESVVVVVFVIFFTCLIVGLDHVFAAIFNAILFGK